MLYSSREIQTLFQRARHTGGGGGGKDAFFSNKKSCVNVVTGVKVANTVIVATNGMEFATKHNAESTAKNCTSYSNEICLLIKISFFCVSSTHCQFSGPRKGASLDPQLQDCNKLIAICKGNKTLLWIKGRKFLHSCPIRIMLRRCINMMHIAWTCVDTAEVFNHVVKS